MNVFSEICEGLRAGEKLYLATIVRTTGSVPAPIHSRMLVSDNGGLRTRGSVGGGCLDGAVLRCVKDGRAGEGAVLERFDLGDEFGETEFACGGSVAILTEPLRRGMLPLFEQVERTLAGGSDCVIRTTLSGEGRTVKTLYGPDGSVLGGGKEGAGNGSVREIVRSLDARNPAHAVTDEAGEQIFEFIEADPPLVIFGGGHVGKAVAEYAVPAGFSVTVVEDRAEFASPERFPGARAVLCTAFERALESVDITEKTFVVIVTRGHRHDESALELCTAKSPRYLGMIGSRKKVEISFERLKKAGVNADRLSRVHAPIGLAIGARTAGEIGISVVAEMISVRRSSGPGPSAPAGR